MWEILYLHAYAQTHQSRSLPVILLYINTKPHPHIGRGKLAGCLYRCAATQKQPDSHKYRRSDSRDRWRNVSTPSPCPVGCMFDVFLWLPSGLTQACSDNHCLGKVCKKKWLKSEYLFWQMYKIITGMGVHRELGSSRWKETSTL